MIRVLFLAFVVLGLAFTHDIAADSKKPATVRVGRVSKTSPCCLEIRAAAKTMLRQHEGVHSRVYLDTEGNRTIGVGFNLDRPDAAERIKRIRAVTPRPWVSRATILAGDKLRDDQIEALLDVDLTDTIADLVTLFPRFDEMPKRVQLALIDLRFNCGPAGFRTFVNTLKSFAAGEYHDAAKRLSGSRWAQQVGPRARRVIGMLRGAQ